MQQVSLRSLHHRGDSDVAFIGSLRVPADATSRSGGASEDEYNNKIHGSYITRRRNRAREADTLLPRNSMTGKPPPSDFR